MFIKPIQIGILAIALVSLFFLASIPVQATESCASVELDFPKGGETLHPGKTYGIQYKIHGIIDSDKDTVINEEDLFPYDFDNDGVPDADEGFDVDNDGIIDFPYGNDMWMNTTLPANFPNPYSGRNVVEYIGPFSNYIVTVMMSFSQNGSNGSFLEVISLHHSIHHASNEFTFNWTVPVNHTSQGYLMIKAIWFNCTVHTMNSVPFSIEPESAEPVNNALLTIVMAEAIAVVILVMLTMRKFLKQ